MNQDLDSFLAERIKSKKTLTLVTGVFDLLHEEHHNFLTKAKELGDLLIVGIESDERVRQMKGKDRPINNQNHRLENLFKWNIADCVFLLPEKFSKSDDHRQLIDRIRPDFMAVSSHSSFVREKETILSEFGAKLIVVHDFNPDFSSSKIIKNLKKKGCS